MKNPIFNILYILSISICFTESLAGQSVNYYLRLFIGVFWIVVWLFKVYKANNKLLVHTLLPKYLLQWVIIGFWTSIIWMVNAPTGYNSSYFTRMISNLVYIIVAIINAYIACQFYGEKSILMAFKSLISVIFVNFVLALSQYGFGNILMYLQNVIYGEFKHQSTLWKLASELELQGPTMVLGIYFVYFLFFYHPDRKNESRRDKKQRLLYVMLSVPFMYIGFKRTVIVAVLAVTIMLFLIKQRKLIMKDVINVSGIIMIVLFFGYIVVVKYDIISLIAMSFNIDTMGRLSIYSKVSQLFEISPLYLGTGFCFLSKYMYDSIGFVSHSESIRMYAELGAIPYFFWVVYNLISVPKQVASKFGANAGKIVLAVTIYVFTTYLVENTLVMYPMQYSLGLFVFVSIFNNSSSELYVEKGKR